MFIEMIWHDDDDDDDDGDDDDDDDDEIWDLEPSKSQRGVQWTWINVQWPQDLLHQWWHQNGLIS